MILFEDVPVGEGYTLEVRDDRGAPVTHANLMVAPRTGGQFTVLAPGDPGGGSEAPEPAGDEEQLEVIGPGDFDAVCTNFVAYGTTDHPAANVSGSLTLGSTVIYGSTIQQPTSRGSWVIQFLGVPDGNGYRLDVSNTAGDAAHVDGINVSASNCP